MIVPEPAEGQFGLEEDVAELPDVAVALEIALLEGPITEEDVLGDGGDKGESVLVETGLQPAVPVSVHRITEA